ncbi:MAG: hypothetical protein PHP93_06830 [Kiritimatiellales bacterium]|nr:hypothetical protein [Kiritimatiellales bacterium]
MINTIAKNTAPAPAGIHGAEIQLQACVLNALSGGDNVLVMKLIDKISPEVRAIITDFEKKGCRLPTPDEIIWIIGEHHKLDPRYVDHLLEKTVNVAAIQAVKAAIEQHTPTNAPL